MYNEIGHVRSGLRRRLAAYPNTRGDVNRSGTDVDGDTSRRVKRCVGVTWVPVASAALPETRQSA